MEANIVITGAWITPNPVNTGGDILVSIQIKEKVPVLAGIDEGQVYYLADSDEATIRVE